MPSNVTKRSAGNAPSRAFHGADSHTWRCRIVPERRWHAVRILVPRMPSSSPALSSVSGAVDAPRLGRRHLPLVAVGLMGALLAALSVVDMFLPKAYDGVVPDPYSVGGIFVRDLVPGGAAERAGLKSGDVILGIGHHMLNKATDAPPELLRHRVGESVDYLVRRGGDVFEKKVSLTPYRLGSPTYYYFVFLGLLFFVLGVFVVSRRPDDSAVQVFYVLCILFMEFFVCRLRPSSYYWIDYVVQIAGTLALFLLPAVFLHFFLLFPEKKTFRFAERRPADPPAPPFLAALQRFLNGSPLLLALLYSLPPVLYVLQMAGYRHGGPRRLIYGAPTLNWILLADYLILGLLALAHTWWTSADRTARRPILVLLLGTVGGIVPFVVFAVFFPSLFREDRYLLWGVVPMALIPLTFAYAIVRFRLFDVQVIVRKSLVYAVLTAVVTGMYALAVVAGNALVSNGLVHDGLLVARVRVRLRPRRRAALRPAAPAHAEGRGPRVLPRPGGLPDGAPRDEPLGRLAARAPEAARAPHGAHGRPPAPRAPRAAPAAGRRRRVHGAGGRGGGRPAAPDGRRPPAAPRRQRRAGPPRGGGRRRPRPRVPALRGSAARARDRRRPAARDARQAARPPRRRPQAVRGGPLARGPRPPAHDREPGRPRPRGRGPPRGAHAARRGRARPRHRAGHPDEPVPARAPARSRPGVLRREPAGARRRRRLLRLPRRGRAGGRAPRARPRRRLRQVDPGVAPHGRRQGDRERARDGRPRPVRRLPGLRTGACTRSSGACSCRCRTSSWTRRRSR